MRRFSKCRAVGVGIALMLAAAAAFAADSLDWRAREQKVDANIQSWDLSTLLKKIARQTGWKVYVEKGAAATVSVKFKNQTEDEALRRLLGKLNYSKDQTNGVTRLFVFNTAVKAATQAVPPEKKNYRIANEDLVKLKRGATNSMDQLAKKLGAKIIGRDDRIGLYRLQFDNAADADAGLLALASDPSVAAADGNYLVDRPTPTQVTQTPNPSGQFNLNATPSANGPMIGLVDTSVDPPSQFSPYMLSPINVTGQQDTPGDQPTHGTMVLETLVDAMGNNPSKILPVDVYGSGDSTTTYELMEGVLAAINAGANPINISSGGTGDSAMLGNLIQQAEQKGIVFVAASGNTPGEVDYPASYPGVVSVTASTQTVNGPITGTTVTGGSVELAPYANDPPGTQVIAPGTTLVQWNGQTWVAQGTSFAAPDTTGTIVDLMNQNHISLNQAVNMVTKACPAPRN
jgi:hypothetical protein